LKTVKYQISIKGLSTPSGSIAFSALRKVIDVLSEGSERALRLALEGASVKTGRTPSWLSKSADFTLRGVKRGTTTLVFDAHTLGETAGDQIQQLDFWGKVPQLDDTALTLLAKSVSDVKKKNIQSDSYDPGVLESLAAIKSIFADGRNEVRLVSEDRPHDGFYLNTATFEEIDSLRKSMPPPQAILVSGFFNMIQHSQKSFELTSESGSVVRGRIDDQLIPLEMMRRFWGRKVTVKGVLHYGASGKPRMLEAQTIETSKAGDEILESVHAVRESSEWLTGLSPAPEEAQTVSSIWGRWPGDENIEDLLGALREDSPERDE
jgi:hypothetical protein